jgi:hypothetical protein
MDTAAGGGVIRFCAAGEVAFCGRLQPKGRVVCVLAEWYATTVDGFLVPLSPLAPGCGVPPGERWLVLQPTDDRMPFVLAAKTDAPSEVVAGPHAHADALWLATLPPNLAADDGSYADASHGGARARRGTSSAKGWPATSRFQRAAAWSLRRLGAFGDLVAEYEVFLRANRVGHGHF